MSRTVTSRPWALRATGTEGWGKGSTWLASEGLIVGKADAVVNGIATWKTKQRAGEAAKCGWQNGSCTSKLKPVRVTVTISE
jgi:hypothetical protein